MHQSAGYFSLLVWTSFYVLLAAHEYPELWIDERKAPTEPELHAAIARELRSLPFEFLMRHEAENRRLNDSCAPLPNILELKYHNTYWQTHSHGALTYHLYGAYYDNRKTVTQTPVVRLLGMINQIDEDFPPNYCQLWFDEQAEPVIVPVFDYKAIWHKYWGSGDPFYYPHIMSCKLDEAVKDLIPQSVSLVSQQCERATNCLKVTYEPLPPDVEKSGFGVCVKALWFSHVDHSARLVEWLELLRTLGATKVVLYDLQVHPNMSKVLRHYERQGFVDAPPITLGRGEPNLPHFTHFTIKRCEFNHRLNQIMGINDCFYRYMYQHDYIAVCDTDEVIMPLGNLSHWQDIVRAGEQLKDDNCPNYASLAFQNIYFPKYTDHPPYSSQLPKYFYMMQHVERVEKHLDAGNAAKCFHNTNHVLALHNHYSLHQFNACYAADIDITTAQLQHYREPDVPETMENPVIDANIWRFKDQVVERSMKVFRELGFFKKLSAPEEEKAKTELR